MFEKNLQEFFVIFFFLITRENLTDESQNQNLNHVACP